MDKVAYYAVMRPRPDGTKGILTTVKLEAHPDEASAFRRAMDLQMFWERQLVEFLTIEKHDGQPSDWSKGTCKES